MIVYYLQIYTLSLKCLTHWCHWKNINIQKNEESNSVSSETIKTPIDCKIKKKNPKRTIEFQLKKLAA